MKKICIVGGCGHVGLPLGLVLADRGFDVTLLDINANAVGLINKGIIPFQEEGAEELLKKEINKNLFVTDDADVVRIQDVVIFITGTPVDEHHNPKIHEVLNVVEKYLPLMNKEQLIVLRSTIYPGTTEIIEQKLQKHFNTRPKLAFCPERILQGKGIEEIKNLPQIVSAVSDEAAKEASEIFSKVAPKIIRLEPIEAELSKLMLNTWRYLEFAIANQFYMMVEDKGLDFYKIFEAMKEDYPRAKNYCKPGLAAGPCLFKDTMQLSAFYRNQFFLGQSAMLVNEGLPNFLVSQLEKKLGSLKNKKVALLGMTFKANNDDIRESLSFKIKKELEFKLADVLPSDPYLKDTYKLEDALSKCDAVILGVPHNEYLNLKIDKPYVDCWNVWK
ncbi:MAG TPA: nucleotide sugar dehydrogenase [Candidatus Stercorousia faecigallinarum]|nr:nucleotide sugar dehydrogenase [Candidatus Stercorousia faecigallinarum]